MRIRKVFMEQGGARYIPKQNIIYYDEILDKFPKLKKKLIAHEEQHAKRPHNYLYHVFIDIRDYYLLLSKEYIEYDLHRMRTLEPTSIAGMVGSWGYWIFNWVIQIILCIPRMIMQGMYLFEELIEKRR